jgi:hypothetical protein
VGQKFASIRAVNRLIEVAFIATSCFFYLKSKNNIAKIANNIKDFLYCGIQIKSEVAK